MYLPVLGLTFSIAAFDWLAVGKKWTRLDYLAKPATMVALLTWLVLARELRGAVLWFALGIAFSLAGDVFLMLPHERFIPGLLSFLLAHVAYIAGFNQTFPPWSILGLFFLAVTATTGILIYRRLAAGLAATGAGKLKIPVAVYASLISLMALSALNTFTRPEWQFEHALLASAGAVLFMISDGLLAWNRFVAPISYGRLKVRIFYHLGQIALIAGAALHLAS
ncbi:MAG: lysoplasmalogenase [Chloroflexota bacterium]|nr:MAG: lysoplasmalogenase [Chloroflexota bacterium]